MHGKKIHRNDMRLLTAITVGVGVVEGWWVSGGRGRWEGSWGGGDGHWGRITMMLAWGVLLEIFTASLFSWITGIIKKFKPKHLFIANPRKMQLCNMKGRKIPVMLHLKEPLLRSLFPDLSCIFPWLKNKNMTLLNNLYYDLLFCFSLRIALWTSFYVIK